MVFVLIPAPASEEAGTGLALLSPAHSLGLQLPLKKKACSFTRPLPLIWGYDGIIDFAKVPVHSYCLLGSGVNLEKFPVLAPPSCTYLDYASNLGIEIWIGREEVCVCARVGECLQRDGSEGWGGGIKYLKGWV